jgi:hypothetical protein
MIVIERLTELLARTPTIEIATHGAAPWIAAAFFAEEGPWRLRLMMEARGTTLGNMLGDPRVAVMIQRGDAFSLFAQGAGQARVAEGAGAAFQAALIAKTPGCAGLVTLPGQVPVVIDLDRWRLTDVPAGWLPGREITREAASRAA